tara:strand:+ start:6334 stop:6807 length:474 start_codon:yes stop_codon:yes gene_type:complete
MNEPKIIEFEGSLLSGISKSMDLQTFAPAEVWSQFMPRISRVNNRLNDDLISLRSFEGIPLFGPNASPVFVYWGGVETEVKNDGFEHIHIPSGTYAVFHFKGLSSDSTIWRYIYGEWLPNSSWELDDKPHFERLGPAYKNNHPDSEEEIYIPLRCKK